MMGVEGVVEGVERAEDKGGPKGAIVVGHRGCWACMNGARGTRRWGRGEGEHLRRTHGCGKGQLRGSREPRVPNRRSGGRGGGGRRTRHR